MSDPEVRQFLEEQVTVIVATLGPDGFPHVVPMWYGMVHGVVHTWTYRTSQKAINIERDPRATLLVEAGETYAELRGVMIEAHAEVVDDPAVVDAFRLSLSEKTSERVPESPGTGGSTGKRVTHRYRSRRVVSWDHRRLGGRH